MDIPHIEGPEKFEKTDWDSVFLHLVGFKAWVEKWKKKREEKVKRNHEVS